VSRNLLLATTENEGMSKEAPGGAE